MDSFTVTLPQHQQMGTVSHTFAADALDSFTVTLIQPSNGHCESTCLAASRTYRYCRSAAPPSHFSRRSNRSGEGALAEGQHRHVLAASAQRLATYMYHGALVVHRARHVHVSSSTPRPTMAMIAAASYNSCRARAAQIPGSWLRPGLDLLVR